MGGVGCPVGYLCYFHCRCVVIVVGLVSTRAEVGRIVAGVAAVGWQGRQPVVVGLVYWPPFVVPSALPRPVDHFVAGLAEIDARLPYGLARWL